MNQNLEKLKQVITSIANFEKFNTNIHRSILPIAIFYKRLCDRQLKAVLEFVDAPFTTIDEALQNYNQAMESDPDSVVNFMNENLGYFVPEPYSLFEQQAIEGKLTLEEFPVIFTGDENLSDQFLDVLGEIALIKKERGEDSLFDLDKLDPIIKSNFNEFTDRELGDLFEELCLTYLIPRKISPSMPSSDTICNLIPRLVMTDLSDKSALRVYDPTVGLGFLLSRTSMLMSEALKSNVKFVGQDIDGDKTLFAYMNLCMHGVKAKDIKLLIGDTLSTDLLPDEKFDAVMVDTPLALRWEPKDELKDDPRYQILGSVPSKRSADFAFVAHAFYHLDNDGTLAMVLPPGVLFRGGSEGKIRQSLLEHGAIYAVIGLPSATLYDTSISPVVVVFKKNYKNKDVLFIDASHEYKTFKFRNIIEETTINKIMDVYSSRESIKGYSKLVSFDEIKKNDFELSVSVFLNDKPSFKNECALKDIIKDIHLGSLLTPTKLKELSCIGESNIRYLDARNIQNGDIKEDMLKLKGQSSEYTKSLSKKGDLIISRCASPIKVTVNNRDEDIVISGNMYSITIDTTKANPYYLSYFFNSELGRNILNMNATGIAIKQLNFSAIEKVIIPLPSLEEQDKLVLKAENIRSQQEDLKAKLEELNSLSNKVFDSLIGS